nr:MAG TPA: hypothetical protein [Caudoviricetes sp.]
MPPHLRYVGMTCNPYYIFHLFSLFVVSFIIV